MSKELTLTQMKRNRKIKLLIATSGLMVAAIAPITTLSSCASISQYFLPLTFGGVGSGPFSEVLKAIKDNNLGSSYLNDAGDLTTKKDAIAAESYADYLPNNYITYTSRASKSTQAYSYANPEDINGTIVSPSKNYPTDGQG
jgi:hypothetical protein